MKWQDGNGNWREYPASEASQDRSRPAITGNGARQAVCKCGQPCLLGSSKCHDCQHEAMFKPPPDVLEKGEKFRRICSSCRGRGYFTGLASDVVSTKSPLVGRVDCVRCNGSGYVLTIG